MMKVLETAIAILMILTIFLLLYRNAGPIPDFETTNWKLVGYNALKNLDWSLGLRQEVQTGNTTAIEAKLSPLMPETVNYTVKICDVSCASPGIPASASGIVSVSYIVAGFRDSFAPRQVVLYMWAK